jgi:hypothetical protein
MALSRSFTVEERFEDGHIPEPTTGCWLWLNSLSRDGYGKIRTSAGRLGAHVYSYETFVGPTNGLCVLHRCDTPWCVNPDHLFVGTRTDNNKDRAKKGRNGNRWVGLCQKGHDLTEHGYTRPDGSRFCYTCQEVRRKSR